MKFKRIDLIDRVQAEILRRTTAAEEKNAKAEKKAATERAQYVATTNPLWAEFGKNIAKAVRAGRPVTAADAPVELRNGWSNQVPLKAADWWDQAPEYTADTAALDMLLDLLNAASDDEITTASLERLGFRAAQLFRH